MLSSPTPNSTSQPQFMQTGNAMGGVAPNHSRLSRADINLMSPPASSLKNLVSPKQGKSMPRISTESRNAPVAI